MESIEKIKNGLKNNELEIPKHFINKFDKSLEIITNHINILNEEKSVKIERDSDEFRLIYDTLKLCKSYTLENPLKESHIRFIKNWLYLVYNWNNNVLNDGKVKQEITYLQRILDQHYTIIEAIDHLKFIMNKNKKFQSWNPPSFELSRHYLKFLED